MKSTSIRQLHQESSFSTVKNLFYHAVSESGYEFDRTGLQFLDYPICFTINGEQIDFKPALDKFDSKLDEYIQAKAEELLQDYKDQFARVFEIALEDIGDKVSDLVESFPRKPIREED